MAEMIPPLNKQTLSHMTRGEKRVAKCLKTLLEDDYLVWYDIPVGRQRRYPDFIILHPSRGLLCLEVKDWKIDALTNISHAGVTLLTDRGPVTKANPLEQARQYTYEVVNKLQRDPLLVQGSERYQGSLITPYGWGAVFPNITRKQIEKACPEGRDDLWPDHLMIYKEEVTEKADPEVFQKRLWDMFHHQFGHTLTLPQIDRIRWHLFPEIRIEHDGQADFFPDDDEKLSCLPDIVKILDIQQEQLARSLGEGHRVIHGVSGSGKTLILGYRCLHLAQTMKKPILVLCFNIVLAAKLRAFISSRGIGGQVQVYHFHDWCGQQLKTYHVEVLKSNQKYPERQVETVIRAVDRGAIPRAQYGALLIDEGQDFDPAWLKLVVQMVDPEYDSLLLLYDDAQSIYKTGTGLGFTLSSVGIRAQGRTTILKLNYRNTREILQFAYKFAENYLVPHSTDEDHIPLIEPEAAGSSGPLPVMHQCNTMEKEFDYTVKCVKKWHEQDVPWDDMAVLCFSKHQGNALSKQLRAKNIPHAWLSHSGDKKAYSPNNDQVTITTIHSSKGLEFPRVIIIGVGTMSGEENARLLYVGMTRAQERLLITTSKENEFSSLLAKLSADTADVVQSTGAHSVKGNRPDRQL